MADMMKMIKQATAMRGDLKKMQKELKSRTITHTSGGISVTAAGDGSVTDIKIDDELLDPARAQKLEKAVLSTVNGALDKARKEAADEVRKLAGGMGLPPGLM